MKDPVTRSLTSLVVSRYQNLNRELRLEVAKIGCDPDELQAAAEHNPEIAQLHAWVKDPVAIEVAQRDITRWSLAGYQLVPIGDERYPIALATIFDPPLYLLVSGDPAVLTTRVKLSIVGSRDADAEALEFAEQLATYAVQCGAVVVSGLALGADTAAHRGALKGTARGGTIAILGSGLDTLYPAVNRSLADRIIENGGAVISHFEPGVKPLPHNFLDRNRLIAGLSALTVVVQAAARSGSLATARYALEEGRDVAAIPGNLRNRRSEGSNRLIQQGAFPILQVDDLHQVLPELERPLSDGSHAPLLSDEELPFSQWLIDRGEVSVSDLPGYRENPGQLMQTLIDFELRGLVTRLPGNIVASTIALREALQIRESQIQHESSVP